MPRTRKYPEELLERGTRMVFESGRPIAHVARDLGVHRETLRKWVRQVEADEGKRSELLSSEERERLKALERENRELRRANEILKSASAFFAAELDPRRTKSVPSSRSTASASGSSRSAAPWRCRPPPTTRDEQAGDRRARSRTSACSPASARSTSATTAPTATGACRSP